MWKNIAHHLLGPVAHARVRATVRHDAELAAPTGTPIAHGSGPDPDRVVLGSPVVQGIGVTSYDLSFAGHLARKLAALTGRGADVEAHGIDGFDAVKAAAAIRTENLARFDVVLILGGVTEIVTMLPLTKYGRNIRMLLDAIADNAPASLPVLIAGVAPFMQDLNVPAFAVGWMDKRIVAQNAETRAACNESHVAEYVTFAPARAGIRLSRDAAAVYEGWANALLPAVDQALSALTPKAEIEPDEDARQQALDELGVVDSLPDAAVERIVAMARDMLGTDAASLNFIDHNRQWSKATAGFDAEDVPRDDAICNTTIKSPGVYVVEDLDDDPAYDDSPWREGDGHVRFYAGYPLEAPGGERVGALCVMDRVPRRFTASETATLRDLALRAQAVLWEQAG